MYRNVLVALDLSDEMLDFKLLAAAAALMQEGGLLKCIHVVENLSTYAVVEIPTETVSNMLHGATAEMGDRIESAGLDAVTDVRSGKPADTILEVAKEMGADVIIVGSHKPGLPDLFLGSVAGRVVRHAGCDVLVRRPAA